MLRLTILAVLSCAVGNVAATCQGTDKTFKPMSDSSILANPGRGFYTVHETYSSKYQSLDAGDLKSKMQKDKITLVLVEFVLDKFAESDISQTIMEKIGKDFDAVRSAGFMCLVRFSYTQSKSNTKDANLTQLKKHISQLSDTIKKNADIILALQAGFIGSWGEWCFSKNYATVKGDSCSVSASQQSDRDAVLRELLKMLPNNRQVQLRTPGYKQKFCKSGNVDPSQAFGTSDCARIGVHNDCFMASDNDQDTFTNSEQKNWLKKEGLYTIVGGETCNNNFRSDCKNNEPPSEISNQRFTYLNQDYHEGVISKWKNSGCYNKVANYLGYRFQLVKGTFPTKLTKGGKFCATVTVSNTGVAPSYVRHDVEVILRHQSSGKLSGPFKQQNIDIRRWAPGATSSFDLTFTVPTDVQSGKYDVLLSLPDASSSLASKANYRILFANGDGVQDLKDRYNILTQVTV